MNRKELLSAYGIVPVGKRTVAMVDAVDAPIVFKFEWRLKSSKFRPTAYTRDANGRVFYLHHCVCAEANGPRPSPDHVCEALNGDSLDCRRENLRWALRDETGYRRAKRLGDTETLAAYARVTAAQAETIHSAPQEVGPRRPAEDYVRPINGPVV